MSISLDHVTFSYDNGPTILTDVSIDIPAGTFTLVRGPSGAGKSTLLRLFCRLEEPQSGIIRYRGIPISNIPPAELRRSVAYIQQVPTLLEGTVRDNLLLPFSFKAHTALTPPSDTVLCNYLASFLLDCICPDDRADTLSVGQSQRICLIRSLLLQPDILLMDEPTASLDACSADVVLAKTAELNLSGTTIVMISHSQKKPSGITHTIHVDTHKASIV